MVLYFTGTGNSKYAAQRIAKGLGDTLLCMNDCIRVGDTSPVETGRRLVIVRQDGVYEAQEGCLSLAGVRKTKRFQTIKVQWQNEKLQLRRKTFTGWTAEVIQHEIDHCEGILIWFFTSQAQATVSMRRSA